MMMQNKFVSLKVMEFLDTLTTHIYSWADALLFLLKWRRYEEHEI